ncbi:hypothetical protein B0H14DRAFT_2574138 [Mycena olivaceomarginata]|nr:hypothetical protein B0H14DRAFT_2574138 [Mycena olivaceomarginata]
MAEAKETEIKIDPRADHVNQLSSSATSSPSGGSVHSSLHGVIMEDQYPHCRPGTAKLLLHDWVGATHRPSRTRTPPSPPWSPTPTSHTTSRACSTPLPARPWRRVLPRVCARARQHAVPTADQAHQAACQKRARRDGSHGLRDVTSLVKVGPDNVCGKIPASEIAAVKAIESVIDEVHPGNTYTLVRRIRECQSRIVQTGLDVVDAFYKTKDHVEQPAVVRAHARYALRFNGPASFKLPTLESCRLTPEDDDHIKLSEYLESETMTATVAPFLKNEELIVPQPNAEGSMIPWQYADGSICPWRHRCRARFEALQTGALITQSHPDNDGTPGTGASISAIFFTCGTMNVAVGSSAHTLVVDYGACSGTWDFSGLHATGGLSQINPENKAVISRGTY